MTLIECLKALIASIGADIKALKDDKVDKTATIAIANGGTGATSASTARTNLGLGTAATKNTGTAVGNVAEFVTNSGISGTGLLGVLLGITPDTTPIESIKGGFFRYADSSTQRPSKMGNYDNYGFVFPRQAAKYGASLWLPYYSQSNKQVCLRVFGITTYVDYYFYTDQNMPSEDVQVKSLQSGSASYKKCWRKLTVTLPSQAGEITKAHGVTNIEMLQAKVTASDGIVSHQNDPDVTRQFYIRVNGANLVLGVASTATAILGKAVTIYVGEEL